MKADIHPKYTEITLVMTNGDKFVTKSTLGKKELHLDADYRSHPAWTGGISSANKNASKIASFNKKFAGIGSFSSNKKKNIDENK